MDISLNSRSIQEKKEKKKMILSTPMDTMDFYPETLVNINDFELHDFIEDPNFDKFINLIRVGENEDAICNINSDLMNGCFIDNPFLSCPPNPFDQYSNTNNNFVNAFDPTSSLSSLSCFDGETKGLEGGEENDGDNYSSATTTTITTKTASVNTKPRSKTDRSKTLISERRRRSRMKEKLYALRSLVPNITKMDKASIIGDSVSYVYQLQSQAKKLKAEVAGLEASLAVSKNYQGSIENPKKIQSIDNINGSMCKKIIQMEMFQVEERGFYVKIVCNKGEGVAASLYRSLESLRGFNVQNSNLATVSDTFLLTFSLNVKSFDAEINLPNMKLWVIGAFLNHGFDFIPSNSQARVF